MLLRPQPHLIRTSDWSSLNGSVGPNWPHYEFILDFNCSMSWPPTDILAARLLPLMGRWPQLHIDQRARGLSRATFAVGCSQRRSFNICAWLSSPRPV